MREINDHSTKLWSFISANNVLNVIKDDVPYQLSFLRILCSLEFFRVIEPLNLVIVSYRYWIHLLIDIFNRLWLTLNKSWLRFDVDVSSIHYLRRNRHPITVSLRILLIKSIAGLLLNHHLWIRLLNKLLLADDLRLLRHATDLMLKKARRLLERNLIRKRSPHVAIHVVLMIRLIPPIELVILIEESFLLEIPILLIVAIVPSQIIWLEVVALVSSPIELFRIILVRRPLVVDITIQHTLSKHGIKSIKNLIQWNIWIRNDVLFKEASLLSLLIRLLVKSFF